MAGNEPAYHSFIFSGRKVIGTVTSAAWCPTAGTDIAFARLEMHYAATTVLVTPVSGLPG